MTKPSRIANPLDLARDGRQVGHLRLPHSVHRSAYGFIPIPIVHLANGSGPRVLLMSGNHGDEYEGQIALGKLIRALHPASISGRLTILPAANFPAVRAGRRTSPIDEGNLNRSFPGSPDGTATEIIAHFIEGVLMQGVDWVIDVHSGGSSLMYLPTVLTRQLDDPAEQARAVAGMEAIGAPFGLLIDAGREDRTGMAAAIRQGAIGITTELGGGGTVSPATVGLAERGLRRLLHLIGLLREEPPPPEREKTRIMVSNVGQHLVYASEPGLFEPLVELGAEVEQGQEAARIHPFEAPWKEPEVIRFPTGGTVVCKRMPTLTEPGDCLFQLAVERGGH